MLQWVTVLSFSVGILLAHFGCFSWPLLAAGLVIGVVALVFQHWRNGNPWIPFVWNVAVVGATWLCLRQNPVHFNQDTSSPTFIEQLSGKVREKTQACFLESGVSKENVAILNAMLLGNRKALGNEQKMLFRSAGAQHLLALSGLHLGIFLGALSFLILRHVRFTRWKWPLLAASLALLWTYCAIAGMPKSLLRAMLMTSLFYISLYGRNSTDASINLANTLLIMLLLDPGSLFDVGTQLSFVAVGSLIWLYPVLSGIIPSDFFARTRIASFGHRVWQLFMVSVSAWLGTMPLCIYYFHQFQPWQPLASIVLVPSTTILLYLAVVLLLICVLGLWMVAVPFAKVLTMWMDMENGLLTVSGHLPFSTLRCGDIHEGHVVILYLLLFILGVSIQARRKVQLYSLGALLLGIAMLLVL